MDELNYQIMLQTIEQTRTHVETADQELHVFHRNTGQLIVEGMDIKPGPDRVWKEVYGIKDGKMSYLYTVTPERKTRTIKTEESYLDWEGGTITNKNAGTITISNI